jgi:mannose-6-phosphate isomerase-like protein (cupin superfamily)
MDKKTLSKLIPQLKEPWKPLDLGTLDGQYQVLVVWYKGSFDVHKHDHDELLLVLQGEIEIRTRTRTIKLRKGESYLIRKGRPHESFSKRGAYVIKIGSKATSTVDGRK